MVSWLGLDRPGSKHAGLNPGFLVEVAVEGLPYLLGSLVGQDGEAHQRSGVFVLEEDSLRNRQDVHGVRHDPTQLLLDAQNGVRGYPARTGDGSRRIAASLEWRRSLTKIGPVQTGAVLFVDAGAIWSETRRLADAPLLVGVGAGLRLGLARLIGAPVLRLDLGYGVRGGTWEVSRGLGQRF